MRWGPTSVRPLVVDSRGSLIKVSTRHSNELFGNLKELRPVPTAYFPCLGKREKGKRLERADRGPGRFAETMDC